MPIYIHHAGKHLKEKWPEKKCDPLYAPFAGYFVDNPNDGGFIKAGATNVSRCLYSWIKAIFSVLLKPFQFVIKMVHKATDVIRAMIDKFRQQLGVIREMLVHMAFKVFERIQNIGASFINLFLRLREMMKRGMATFQMVVYTFETLAFTFESIISGPIGDMAQLAADHAPSMIAFAAGPAAFGMFPQAFACTFCFHPDTFIQGDKGEFIIRRSQLGKDGVTGKMRFQSNTLHPLLQLGGDLVTPSHLVEHDGKWIEVGDHPEAGPCGLICPEVYCIATESHRICTRDHVYMDWDETDNLDTFREQKECLLKSLGNTIDLKEKPEAYRVQEGFSREISPLDVIGIGEWLPTPQTTWYVVDQDTLVTSSTVVYANEKWVPVCESGLFPIYKGDNRPPIVYSAASLTNTLDVGGKKFRDMLEAEE